MYYDMWAGIEWCFVLWPFVARLGPGKSLYQTPTVFDTDLLRFDPLSCK